MKLCKTCQHFRAPAEGLNVTEYAKCMYGRAVSPVTGHRELKTQQYEYCIALRKSESSSDCGPVARFWVCGNYLDDGEGPFCGDEGRLCETCFQERAKEHEWMRGKPLSAVTGILSDEEKQELRDAGRGHLVAP